MSTFLSENIVHKVCLRLPVDMEFSDWKYLDSREAIRPRNDTLDGDIVESDIELDDSDVVQPDYDAPVEMGDPSIEPTKENQEAAQVSKSKALDAFCKGKHNGAINHLTQAIILNPKLAVLYAGRASVFVKLKKPNAAIRDADAALKINPDLAKGYKARGMARALLGLWEGAARDLREALKLDFDEETSMMLKKVESNAKKIEEHQQKYERLRKEKELRKAEPAVMLFQDDDFASILRSGQVNEVKSARELDANFNAASEMSRLAIVYCTAAWSSPCTHIAPLYARLAEKYPGVLFLKVYVDKTPVGTLGWNFGSIPRFYFIKSGREIEKVVELNMDSLEKKIIQHARA